MKKVLAIMLVLLSCHVALAHSGGVDSKGGHTNRATGEYHYHHGYPAHQHENGECPYDFDDKTVESSGSSSGSSGFITLSSNDDYWYSQYQEEQKARVSAEKKLAELEDSRKNSMYLSALAGLAVGFISLFITNRNTRKRREGERYEKEQRIKEVTNWNSTLITENKSVKQRLKSIDPVLISEQAESSEVTVWIYREKKRIQEQVAAQMRSREERKKSIESAITLAEEAHEIENDNIDFSMGAVYISRSASDDYFHHSPTCDTIKNPILVSKLAIAKFLLKPCPVCSSNEPPAHDPPVEVTILSSGKCYHRKGAFCILCENTIPLSEAKARGYRPCSKCGPPTKGPKVWF